MSALVEASQAWIEEIKLKPFDLDWTEDDYFSSNQPSKDNAPSSPDTVCPDSKLTVQEPILPEAGTFFFDADLFLPEKAFSDMENFRFFDQLPSSEAADNDEDSASSFTDEASREEDSPKPAAAAAKPSRKRSKTVSASSDDSEEEEATTPKPKKSKASPKFPRSRMPTSAFRGVSRCTKDGRWQARIRVCKEVVYLGRFQTEELAARRYDEAARLHHGASAMLNFVTSEDIALGRKSVFSSEKSAAQEE